MWSPADRTLSPPLFKHVGGARACSSETPGTAAHCTALSATSSGSYLCHLSSMLTRTQKAWACDSPSYSWAPCSAAPLPGPSAGQHRSLRDGLTRQGMLNIMEDVELPPHPLLNRDFDFPCPTMFEPIINVSEQTPLKPVQPLLLRALLPLPAGLCDFGEGSGDSGIFKAYTNGLEHWSLSLSGSSWPCAEALAEALALLYSGKKHLRPKIPKPE